MNSIRKDEIIWNNEAYGSIITIEDARKRYMSIEKELLLESINFPTKPSSDGYYHLNIKDETKKSGWRQIKDKTLEGLREKAYQYEKGLTGRSRKTFRDLFFLVQDEKIRRVKDPQRRISVTNTVTKTKADYQRYFDDTAFERKYVDEISKNDVEKIVEANLTRYDLKNKAFLSMRSIIKITLESAFENYLVPENVYSRVDFKKYRDMIVPDTPISERVYSEDDVNRIFEVLHRYQVEKPSYMPAYAVEAQMMMGMRASEVPPLTFSDVYDDYIYVHREQIAAKNEDGSLGMAILDHTKNWKDRRFPRTGQFNEFYDRLTAALSKYYPGTEYLFPADTKLGCVTNNMTAKLFTRICRSLGLPISKEYRRGTHSIRRNQITKVINASGGNLMLASQIFGNSPETARRFYYTGVEMSEALKYLNP